MIWSTNYGRLLSQTLFTLFFAGRSYAPRCIIDNLNIQDWLQSHYINACGAFADRISKFENGRLLDESIIGWDSLNEPFEGLCGWVDLNLNPQSQGSTLKKGTYPTPAQSLRLGMGIKQTVDNWSFGKMGPARDGRVTIDPKGLKMWAEPIDPDQMNGIHGELPDGTHTRWGWKRDVKNWPLGKCIWALHGVWDIETGYILRPDYFRFKYDHSSPHDAIIHSQPVEFLIDHWKPHFIAYAARIRQSHPLAILFIQPPVFAPPPPLPESTLQGRCAYAPHYYDGLTLVTRHWNWFNADALGLIRGKYGHGIGSSLRAVKLGESAIRKSLQEQLGYLKGDVGLISASVNDDEETDDEDPNTPPHPTPHPKYPTLIGEIGTPFDMDSKKSYGYTDKGKYKYDYTSQTKALDASLNGCDGKNGLSWTVWGYVPDDHTWEWGDGWNMEDLSLWSWGDWREEEEEEEDVDLEAMHSRMMLTGQPTESMAMQESTPMKGYSPNPYDFLANGARAVQAFARPWATKVVGKPVDMTFDIRNGVFKLEVEVRKEDSTLLGGKKGKDGKGADVEVVSVVDDERIGSQEEEEGLATEIYIPLVHFAHPKVLESSWMAGGRSSDKNWPNGLDLGARKRLVSNATTATAATATMDDDPTAAVFSPPSSSSSSSSTLLFPIGDPPNPILANNKSKSNPNDQSNCSNNNNNKMIINPSMELTPDLVDIQVEVSAGRWSVCGQTLKWWYDDVDVPHSGRPGLEGEKKKKDEQQGAVKRYTIEIKRRDGPIRIDNVGKKSGGEGGRRRRRRRSCCEELCGLGDGSCLVM